ncbi:hypothetical protein AC578_9936 [Pseudocercospora eumusae]|uniref:Uncharacterized protein n=1 Tax=Pseudocercospora eumusae TaxID=321146 RepID=A0A139HB11_9PEZI|nr:hypothetical protein AC578_9936 [Pseudocercospora eumusae]
MSDNQAAYLLERRYRDEDGEDIAQSLDHVRSGRSCGSRLWWLVHAIVLCGNMAVLAYQTACARPMSLRRPFEVVDAPRTSITRTWNLTLGKVSDFTSFDPAVADAAWADISLPAHGWVKISEQQMSRLGKLSSSSVKAADGSGYLALLETFHQIHCLDYLRKTNILYADIYPNARFHVPVPADIHIPHCIDAILMSLQCNSELTLVTQNWVDGWIEPWADWETQHQCRDFQSIVKWARKNKAESREKFIHPELGLVLHDKLNLSALPVNREVRYIDSL